MDNKNVFVAIALSMSVLLFWGAFVDTPKPKSQNQINKNIDTKDLAKNEITPNINPEKLITKVSRKDALVKDDRILIENKKIQGSISLKGAIFDDLSFKNYSLTIIPFKYYSSIFFKSSFSLNRPYSFNIRNIYFIP